MNNGPSSAEQRASAETTESLALRVQHVVFRALAVVPGVTPSILGGKFLVHLKTGKPNPPTVQIFIVNPEDSMRPDLLQPEGSYTPDLVHNVLRLVDVNVPATILGPLSSIELALVFDWAMREHLAAADTLTRRRPRPYVLSLLENRARRNRTSKQPARNQTLAEASEAMLPSSSGDNVAPSAGC
jgi:hypothetical protein